MTRFRGLVWRHVPVGAEPLHLGWILKAARGRWNTRRPRMPCLYTALTPEGAIAELEKHAALFGGPTRRDLVSVQVAVDGVLDLTYGRTRARWGIDLATLTSDTPADLAACRALARRAVLGGDVGGAYGAVLAPSAALDGGVNLIVYVEHTGHLREVTNGPDRVPISPGHRWTAEPAAMRHRDR
ncbi:hypothetical protein tb265_49130 [Gemmatimonadetes bacterium T265]|nr:hypothetical protein tb265_49130 [Gemmatimonadetes bacterium T265]